MGYSIYTTARSDKCLHVVKDVFKTESDTLLFDFGIHFATSTDLTYGTHKPLHVGFNYGSGFWPAWSLSSLLAMMIGRRRHFQGVVDLRPYIICDSDTAIPVVHEHVNRRDYHRVNNHGLPINTDSMLQDEVSAVTKYCRMIHNRLQIALCNAGILTNIVATV